MNEHDLRDDVPRRAALDQADARGGDVVEAAEAQVGDGARCGGDRGAPLLRGHACVGRLAAVGDVDRGLVRRAEDHVADRRRLVEDVADVRNEALVVERRRAFEAHFLHRREQELEPRVRALLAEDPPRRLEHHGDRRLVVGAKDGPPCVPDDALIVDHGLDRVLGRDGVEVRAQEERRAVGGRLETCVEVPHRRADACAGVVLVDVEREIAQVAGDRVGDRPLLPEGLGTAASSTKSRATSGRPLALTVPS